MSDDYPALDKILAVLDEVERQRITAPEKDAVKKCKAAIGDAFIELLGDPT